jgi:hypothetical protein
MVTMPPPEPFDSAIYTRAPILSIGSAITLGRKLADACPKSMPPNVKKAAKKLKTTVEAAQDAWADRQRELGAVSEEDGRVIDQLADNLWSALRSRVQSYSVLPVERFPRSARAGELVTVLFGSDGLVFLKEPYPVQLSTMQTLVRRIDADGLQKEIDELAGPEFLQAIREVLPRYDAMVTALLKRDGASGQNLLEHVRAIQRAIVEYATKLCATVDEDEPETADVAREVLRPLVTLREQAAPPRRAATTEPQQGEAPATDAGQRSGEPK